ncbi:MAG: hypothetical protein IPO41_04775 [Acidobacteria bacterium]|nr:hypothetical protein [Acidobacteriota bacterium]MBK9527629.1 hypothetical protein [Acidobacteriota bacterium]MBP7474863.1 hypothetical protein [Pyrinomonadaceae bacterium]
MPTIADTPTDRTLTQLGAGDLIDRAVRFYRRFFSTFILIAAPPVIIGTIISVGWTLLGRQIFSIGSDQLSAENTFYYLFLWFGTGVIWLTETIATLVVMGGASRNFVRHLLFDEPITFAETYRNTWKRLGGLVVAATLITVLLVTIGVPIFYLGLTIGGISVLIIGSILGPVPILAFIVGLVVVLGVAFGTVWLFFLAASRLAYVPQVMLVEGQGVFAAISRSASLASGNVMRLAALFLFTTLATYSALMLLYVPLAWYASANGIELMSFDADVMPAWYEIAYGLIWQISFILLSPVWMVGLCLLYVDERVRGEGYDIELMAARRLGDIPNVPDTYLNPLQPALSTVVPAPAGSEKASSSSMTTLDLK